MNAAGAGMYQGILDAIDKEDAFMLHENLDGITAKSKKMLAKDIGSDKTESLKNLLKQVEQ
jgi:hypothetical protein